MAEGRVADDPPSLFSIGHSNLQFETFIGLLTRYEIQVVADVRSAPRSRYVPHFDSKPLRKSLHEHGVKYVFLGKELGGRPEGDEFYDDEDHVLYSRLGESALFEAGLDRILGGASDFRVAMLCSEEDPQHCHRHLLIGRVLQKRNLGVAHIRGDGTIQTDCELASHLAVQQQTSLFEELTQEQAWRSTRSVSRRKVHLTSSEF